MTAAMYLHFLKHTILLRVNPRHRVPLTVNIQLLRRCNNACRYCGQDHRDETRLSPAVLDSVFREAWIMGTRRLHFTGGEPLLLDDLDEIVGQAKARGFFVSLATNGVRAEKQLAALKKVDRVLLSFDGPDEVREELCGRGSAAASAGAVRVFREQGIPFWTTTVLTKVNIGCVDWMVRFARQHGVVANFVLFITRPSTGGAEHPAAEASAGLMPSDAEIRAAFRRLAELKARGEPVGSSMPYLREVLQWPDYRSLFSSRAPRRYRCRAWRSTCELFPNGDLYSCDWGMAGGRGVSVLEHGFAAAFMKLPEIGAECRSCVIPCYLESNLIFSLNPGAVLNWMRRL